MQGEGEDEWPGAGSEDSDEEEGVEILGDGAGEDEDAPHESSDEPSNFSSHHLEPEGLCACQSACSPGDEKEGRGSGEDDRGD